MKYDKYIIKKDKTDLLSSLKALNKDIINESLEDYDLDNIEDLKEYIIDSFAFCLSASKTDLFTRLYFQKLLDNEKFNEYVCISGRYRSIMGFCI